MSDKITCKYITILAETKNEFEAKICGLVKKYTVKTFPALPQFFFTCDGKWCYKAFVEEKL